MEGTKDYRKQILDLLKAARRAYARGMQMGSGGNISVRVSHEHMLISASGSSFADCEEDGTGLIVTDYDVTDYLGEIAPSKESILHGFLYKYYKGVNSVIHCHSPWVIAIADMVEALPLVSWQSMVKLKEIVPVFVQHQPAVSLEECNDITNTFVDPDSFPCFIYRGHGVFASGKNAIEAEHLAEFIDECAKIAVLKRVMKAPEIFKN
jgi:L-ribulose-5-phosphate 4-epimerase